MESAKNSNWKSDYTVTAKANTERKIHTSEKSRGIFNEGNKKFSELNEISENERSDFVKANYDGNTVTVENWLYNDNFQMHSLENTYTKALTRSTTEFYDRASSNLHSTEVYFESQGLFPDEVFKQMESEDKYESDVGQEKIVWVDGVQALEVNNNKVNEITTNAGAKNVKSDGNMFSVITPGAAVLQEYKTKEMTRAFKSKSAFHNPMNSAYGKTKLRTHSADTEYNKVISSSFCGNQHLLRRMLSSRYKGKPTIKLRVAPGRAQGDCTEDPNLKNNEKLGVKWKLLKSHTNVPRQNEFEYKNVCTIVTVGVTSQNLEFNVKCWNSPSSKYACVIYTIGANWRISETTNVNICRNNILAESAMPKIWSSCTNNPS